MGSWEDLTTWNALIDGSKCPICQRGEPLDVIDILDTCWLTMPEVVSANGYVCLVFRRQVVELHELNEAESVAFMNDIRRVSKALIDVTGAVKLNHEIHGNTIPHLHMHIFPRYRTQSQRLSDELGIGALRARLLRFL